MLFYRPVQILVLFSRSLGPYDAGHAVIPGGSLFVLPHHWVCHVDSSMFELTIYLHSAVLCTTWIDREPCRDGSMVMDMHVF